MGGPLRGGWKGKEVVRGSNKNTHHCNATWKHLEDELILIPVDRNPLEVSEGGK